MSSFTTVCRLKRTLRRPSAFSALGRAVNAEDTEDDAEAAEGLSHTPRWLPPQFATKFTSALSSPTATSIEGSANVKRFELMLRITF